MRQSVSVHVEDYAFRERLRANTVWAVVATLETPALFTSIMLAALLR